MHSSEPSRRRDLPRLSLTLAAVTLPVAAVAATDGIWAIAVGALLAAVYLGASSVERRDGLVAHAGPAAAAIAAVIFIAVWATAGLTPGLWLLVAVGGLSATLGVDVLLMGRSEIDSGTAHLESSAMARPEAADAGQPPQSHVDQPPAEETPDSDPAPSLQPNEIAPISSAKLPPLPPAEASRPQSTPSARRSRKPAAPVRPKEPTEATARLTPTPTPQHVPSKPTFPVFARSSPQSTVGPDTAASSAQAEQAPPRDQPKRPDPTPLATGAHPAPQATNLTPEVARIADLTWSTLRAMRDLPQPAHNYEINHAVAAAMKISTQARLHRRPQHAEGSDWQDSEWDYRVGWARSALHHAGIGAVEQTSRGWWRVTAKGRGLSASDAKKHAGVYFEAKLGLGDYNPGLIPGFGRANGVPQTDFAPPPTLQDHLLVQLWALAPPCFEELCAEALRRAGYRNVRATGGPGDSGIDVTAEKSDATGTTPIYVQCKAWRGEVALGVVQEFREALRRRSDRKRPGFGWLMTSGTFSTEARAAAERDDAPRLKLVDGGELCKLLMQHDDIVAGGVSVNQAWFDDLVRRCRGTDRYKIQASPPGQSPPPDPQ